MEPAILPDTLPRRSLPPGGRVVMRPMADGAALRSIDWDGAGRGAILFLGGRADFIEKYAESYWHWLAAGYGVSCFDWRGQGLSGRFAADPLLGDCPDFSPWRNDLAEMIGHFTATQPGPHYAVAHSMGAHLLLHHLSVAPAALARAVLLAPMIGVNGGRRGTAVLRLWSRAAMALGRGGRYAPGQRSTALSRRSAARMALLTGDAARFADEGWWTQDQPALALGGISNRWLASAFASSDALLAPGVPERTTTPLLILLGGRERLVDNGLAQAFAARLPAARVKIIADAAHELLRERDPIRDDVLARIDSFLGHGSDHGL